MGERFSYLFRLYLNNKCSKKELREFFRYIRLSKNDEMLRRLIRNVYEDIRDARHPLAAVDEHGDLRLSDPDWHLSHPANIYKSRKLKFLVAACVTTVLIAAGLLYSNRTAKASQPDQSIALSLTKKVTERSEFRYVLLSDSTQVWLNAGSTIEFPFAFSGSKREVYLHGEAYFDVKHSASAPFVIHTGEISTTVLGTAFNIKAYPGQSNITISVSRGKVRVNRGDESLAVLTKGQQVKLSSTDHHVAEKAIAVTTVAAWQQGNMSYDDETFGDILADLERIYNVDIKLTNASVRELKVSTSFRREIGIEQALSILCRLTDTELKQANGLYTIQ